MSKHRLLNIYTLLIVSLLSFSCIKMESKESTQSVVSFSFAERDQNQVVKSTDRKYKLTIVNEKNETVYVSSDQSTTNEVLLFAGKYTIKAQSGTEKDAAFDSPYYYGEKAFEVTARENLNVEIETILSTVKFTVVYGTELDQYFSSYSTIVSNGTAGSNKRLSFVQGSTKSGYFKADVNGTAFNWNTEFLAFGGQPFILQGTINAAKANDHYIITFKIEEGSYESGGVRVIAIVVNETTTGKDDTNLDLGIKRYPEAHGQGFDIDQVKNVSKTDDDQSLIIGFAGFPTLKSVEVSYNCPPLSALDSEGMYKTFELIGALGQETTLADLREDLKLDIGWTTIENCTNGVKFDLTRLIDGFEAAQEARDPYTFTFKITDISGASVIKTLTFNIINSDVETLQPKRWDVWAKRMSISGRWKKDKPIDMSFRVWPADGGSDIKINSVVKVDDETKTFSVDVSGLLPSTSYFAQAIGTYTGKVDNGNIVTIKTEDAPQLINSSFDRWSQGSRSSWYARENEAEAFWDSGNLGANTLSSVNPTEPEYNDVKDGTAAAKMTSRYVVVKFAAGNLYSGKFKALNGTTPDMEFGQKFTARPSKLKGWYKYNSVNINRGSHNGLGGKPDRMHIWMMVTTSKGMPRSHDGNGSPFDIPSIIRTGSDANVQALCFGEFHNEKTENGVDITPAQNMNAYEEFTIDLKYFKNNISLNPEYIVVVMSASKYGDFFTGGEGAQLLVDKLELVYE